MISSAMASDKPLQTTTPQKSNLCFSREESEDIFKCLQMRKIWEDNLLPAPEAKQESFLDSTYGKASLVIGGILVGFIIGERLSPKSN